jgi:tRNA (guanine-N7-)-methyltransferase
MASSKSATSMPLASELGGEGGKAAMPQKKFFRSRAHCNPLSFNDSFVYPASPDKMDMHALFPRYFPQPAEAAASVPPARKRPKVGDGKPCTEITMADIGCGFGGLTIALSPLYPNDLIVGMEIRLKVCEYVRQRIVALRSQSKDPDAYQNVACLRSNTMKYLPCYFKKHQLRKMFFCFPDPCFKKKKHRRRIISPQLLSEYAFVLRPGGLLYTITDVLELHLWMVKHCSEHASFERVPDDELENDPAVPAVRTSTEEGIKVARNKGSKFLAVFRRLSVETAMERAMAKAGADGAATRYSLFFGGGDPQ